MDAITIKSPEWIDAIPITLSESVKAEKGKKYGFKATVLVWDKELDSEWSIISRNGVRYNRVESLKQFKSAIQNNAGIPVMYNHIIDEDEADQLGIINKVYDTDDGLIVEGILNGYKQRVLEEILPGFLNNVSLQVDGDRETIEEQGKEITYARPTDVYEVSFVPVNGVRGANSVQIALAEAVKSANKRLKEKIKEDATTSNTTGATTTKLVGQDEEEAPVTSSAEMREALSKDEIEDELSGIDESFDMDDAKYEEIYNEACDEVHKEEEQQYKELFDLAMKEALDDSTISMDEIQAGIVDLQSAKGVKLESEHEDTYNWLATELATTGKLPPKEHFYRMIAEDHLREDPMYYDHLEEMESKYPKEDSEVQQ